MVEEPDLPPEWERPERPTVWASCPICDRRALLRDDGRMVRHESLAFKTTLCFGEGLKPSNGVITRDERQ